MSNERDIQRMIVRAVRHFFVSGNYGISIPPENIGILEPESAQQTSKPEAFGRKPYDVAFYAQDTTVIFLEVKERRPDGKVPEFRGNQNSMLEILHQNGVEVSYAYNAWAFKVGNECEPHTVLQQAHVRKPSCMSDTVRISPILPAKTLQEYLQNKINAGESTTLIELLSGDKSQLDNLNSMPLMILANLEKGKILIDKEPSKIFREMRKLFLLKFEERDACLQKINQVGAYAKEWKSVTEQIFSMRDKWEQSQHQSITRSEPQGPSSGLGR